MTLIGTRVWSAGKLLILAAALVATYLVFALAGMRIALRLGEVDVPALTARTVNEASAVLTESGLTLRVEEARRFDPKVPAGRIIAQDPSPGVTARRQRSVKVWLSAGPRANTVPRLLGESDRGAQTRLQQDGLELLRLSEFRSNDYPADTVIAQDPPPESRGTRVAMLVNRGERATTYVMPDLIGVADSRAVDLLRSQGFRVAVVAEHPYPGVPAGIVLRQHPRAGFQIAPGEPISLEVSR